MSEHTSAQVPRSLGWRSLWSFYRDHFIKGLCQPILLPLTLLLLLALTMRWFGSYFGLDHLIWHEVWWQQFLVGVAMTFLASRLFFLGYLLDTQQVVYKDRYALPFAGRFGVPLFCHIVGMFVAAVMTVLLVYLVIITARVVLSLNPALFLEGVAQWTANMPRVGAWPFLGGAVLAVVGFVVVLYLPQQFSGWKTTLEKLGATAHYLPLTYGHAKAPEDTDRYLHGLAVLFLVLSLLFYFGVGTFLPVSPIIFLCFLLDIVVGIYGYVKYCLRPWTAVIILFIGVLLFVGGIPRYKYQFPGLEEYYGKPQVLADYAGRLEQGLGPQRKDLLKSANIQFCECQLGNHDKKHKRPLVIVCTSGGGSRAAAWTMAVLQTIESELHAKSKGRIRFPFHVRLMTGASGGMLGATYYTSLLKAPKDYQLPEKKIQVEDYQRITKDFLTPAAARLVYGDLGMMFLPMPSRYDRGMALEEAWNSHLGESFGKATFKEWYADEQAGWRPSLVLSPMLVEDGRRLLISNLNLRATVKNDSSVLRPEDQLKGAKGIGKNTLSISAYEFFRLFPSANTFDNFQVSTAVRMNASFPYISPAAPLPTTPRRRVVDAGYFDNFGVSLAAAWLFSGSNRDWLRNNTTGVLLIQIRDGLDQDERMLQNMSTQESSTPFSRGLEEFISPPMGLYGSAFYGSALRNDELLEVLNRLLLEEQQFLPVVGTLPPEAQRSLQDLRQGNKAPQLLRARTMNLRGKKSVIQRILKQHMPKKSPDELKQISEKVYQTLDRDGSNFFKTVIFELEPKRSASLSWYLTEEEKDDIRAGLEKDRITKRIQQIHTWWQSRQAFIEPAGR